MNNLMLNFIIQNIEPPDDDDGEDSRGSVDIRIWSNDGSGFSGWADVTIHFTDASMSINQIKAEAPIVAKRVLRRIAELDKPDDFPEGLEQRWKYFT